jgi:hypothetical protein
MIAKWIVCDCAANQRESFSLAQTKWRSLQSVPGFLGQLGGWDQQSSKACILGFWRDHGAYKQFMACDHDLITDGNKQEQAYQSIQVSMIDVTLEIPGCVADFRSLLKSSAALENAFLRVACCILKEGQEAQFLETQRSIWNLGMNSSGALLGGVFGRDLKRPKSFYVFSFWVDEQRHADYQREIFPGLKAAAKTERDLAGVLGFSLELRPQWSVFLL